MKFFPGFKWAVSSAFSDPLGACRFEQGDALYNTPDAYKGEWREALAVLEHGIDVKFPPRGEIAVLKEKGDKVFERNWETKVEFDLVHYRDGQRKEPITTTQGRLYTFLRTGDFSLFNPQTQTPPVPLLVKKVNEPKQQFLEAAQAAFVEKMTTGIQKPNLFILAIDITNPVSMAKYHTLKDRLLEFNPVQLTLRPKDAGLKNWESFVTTLNFVGFCMDSNTPERIRDALKQVLYNPVIKKEPEPLANTTAEPPIQKPKGKKERFNLRRHGLFIPYTADTPSFSLVP